jgi:anti-anti-sigma factor
VNSSAPYSLDAEHVFAEAGCVTLAGEWDLNNATVIVDEVVRLIESNRTAIAIDLRRVSYLDSTALSALLEIQKEAERSLWHVVFIRPEDARVWRLFELTALTTRFAFFDTRAAAMVDVALARAIPAGV